MKLNSLEKVFKISYKGKWQYNSFYQPKDVVLWTDNLLYVAKTHNATLPSTAADWEALDSHFANNYVASKFLTQT